MRHCHFLVVLFAVGCQGIRGAHCLPCPKDCEADCPQTCQEDCPASCPSEGSRATELPAPCHTDQPPAVTSCPQPSMVRKEAPAPQKIQVKVPPPNVFVNAQVAPQPASPQAYAAPQMMASPQVAPSSPYQVAPLTAMSYAHSVPVGRARPGITLDFIRIPIPFPRLIAVPTVPEVTVPVSAPQMVAMQSQAFATAPVMPQAVAVQPQAVVTTMPQAAVAQPLVPAAPQAMPVASQATVPVQAQAVVPVQGQAVVPVQGQVIVPVQGQAMISAPGQALAPAPAQAIAVQATLPQTAAVPQTVVLSPQAQKTLSPAEVEAFCRQVEAYKKAMEAHGISCGK